MAVKPGGWWVDWGSDTARLIDNSLIDERLSSHRTKDRRKQLVKLTRTVQKTSQRFVVRWNVRATCERSTKAMTDCIRFDVLRAVRETAREMRAELVDSGRDRPNDSPAPRSV